MAVASASPESGEPPLIVSFSSAGSNDADGSIVNYAWDFGDGMAQQRKILLTPIRLQASL